MTREESKAPLRDTSIYYSYIVFENHKKTWEYSQLICPICMDLITRAVITLCGHCFCERCLFEWNLFNKECPVCRQAIRKEPPHPCPMMNSLIESYLEQSTMIKDNENHQIKKQKFEEWKIAKTYYKG